MNKIKTLTTYGIFSLAYLFFLFPSIHAGEIYSSPTKQADEKTLSRYFELLERYPKLKREGEINNYKNGTYEIVYDLERILAIKQQVYERVYNKSKLEGMNSDEAAEFAANSSRPGIVCEDQFWLWIRDAVISPHGYEHTYNRIVWKCDVEKIGGVAVLPIIVENEVKKIALQLIFRHATNSWEIELPRGASKNNETLIDAAKRELLEETGYETHDLVFLGSITPDSGLTASVVPIFLGEVVIEKAANQDKTEAIGAKYTFTLNEIMQGLKRGFMEIEINNQKFQAPIRDPFLTYAILMAQYDGHI